MNDKNIKGLTRSLIDWLKVVILLLDEVIAAAVVVFLLRFFHVDLPLWLIIILAIVAGGLVFIIHKAVIPSFHNRIVTGQEGMAGRRGKALTDLSPSGTVIIGNEQWKAKAIEGTIESGSEVEVVSIERLTLKVKKRL